MADRERMTMGGPQSYLLAAALVLGSAGTFVGLVLVGELRSWVLVLVAAMLVGAGAALMGWQRAARTARAVAKLGDARSNELEESLAAREEEFAQREQRVEQLEQQIARLQRTHQVQRELNRKLRRKLAELQALHGALGDRGDVRELVLRLAIELLGAEKGLLLSRTDADSDGDLDLACSIGFDNDPEHSAVAQRFAAKVIERDETIRVDDPAELHGDSPTPADEEIENLVAIPMYVTDRFSGVVICANKDGGFGEHDDEVLLAIGDHAGAVLENSRLHGELRTTYLTTVRMLADALEVKDPFLRGHSQEVSEYVVRVAAKLDLPPRRREELVFGSLLHDVGKIGISERILLKPAALSPEERSAIELHPRIGFRLIEQVPGLREIAPGVLHHHERFDGGGYPSGLRGEEIPLEARIIGVVDAFSAMTADRPYRSALTADAACGELERCAGTQFDPEIVRLFVEEVRSGRDPGEPGLTLAEALADPELEVRRAPGEPLLGFAPLAVTDNLTLLYTHRYLHELARAEGERALVQRRPFVVVLVSLTEIGEINAREGYRAGDEAIHAAARVLDGLVSSRGGTACRHGGTCLGAILGGVDEQGAEELAVELGEKLPSDSGPRIATAVWQEGESGEDVVRRALAGLGAPLEAV